MWKIIMRADGIIDKVGLRRFIRHEKNKYY